MKPQYFNVVVAVAVAVATGVVCSNTCTDISRIRQLRQNITLSVSTFLTMAKYTLVICAKECLLRSFCRSFNFNLTSSNCQLNWLSSTDDPDPRLEPAVDSVFSDTDLWPGRVSSGCRDHQCDLNQRCSDINGTAFCDDVGCLKPDPIKGATIHTGKRLVWSFGEILLFGCDKKSNIPKGDLICQTSGSWSSVKCGKN